MAFSFTSPSSGAPAKKSNIIWGVVIFVLLVLVLGGGCTYNSMVSKQEAVDQAWNDVQTSYQRRFDLIPNLVNTVKGYAKHESGTLANVTGMRTGALAPAVQQAQDSLMAAQDAAQAFGGPRSQGPDMSKYEAANRALGLYVNAVHEAYPDLKANENFKDLQVQLEGTENRINTARTRYNEAVKTYNVAIRRFPANIFAGLFGFDKMQGFQADAGAQKAVTVSFDD